MGHRHVVCATDQCHVDRKNKIVTTPAYMDDKARLDALFEGVRKLCSAVVEMA
jgi:enhancing lycopene biosynthesis protein 2